MSDRQKEAAHKAATKYPTDAKSAALEYALLLGRDQASFSEEERQELYDEMCSLLKPYRHPLGDAFGEYMCFIDTDCMVSQGTAFQDPPFLKKLLNIGVEGELYNEIVEYAKNCERIKITAKKCEVELKEHHDILTKAEEVYNNNTDKRSEARNKLVAQSLGLSTGRVPKRLNKKDVYTYYMKEVRHKGFTRSEAVENTRIKYAINSYDATLKILHEYRRNFFKRWEDTSPSLVHKVKARLKGFIPSRR